MRFTDKADAALFLGADMARAAWEAFERRYPDQLPAMRDRLRRLELDDRIRFPDEPADFRAEFNDLAVAVRKALADERTVLGGDGYALPFFVLALALHITVSSMAFGETEEVGVSLVTEALLDLSVHADEAKLAEILKLDTEWIESTGVNDDVEVRMEDVWMAWARTIHQLMERWQEGERRRALDLPEISLDDVPLYSCFISYNQNDEAFCNHLYEKLRLLGVRVWYAPDRMMAGDRIVSQLDRGLQTHDKLLLVLSETSIRSDWVKYEIETALSVGDFKGETVLLPVALMDPAGLSDRQLVDQATGTDLAATVRAMLIPDFSKWQNSDRFDQSFEQLRRALRRLDKPEAAVGKRTQ